VHIRGLEQFAPSVVLALQRSVLQAFDYHPYFGPMPSTLAAWSPSTATTTTTPSTTTTPRGSMSSLGSVAQQQQLAQSPQYVHTSGLTLVGLTPTGFACRVNLVASLQVLFAFFFFFFCRAQLFVCLFFFLFLFPIRGRPQFYCFVFLVWVGFLL
jgi:hypothetical protein